MEEKSKKKKKKIYRHYDFPLPSISISISIFVCLFFFQNSCKTWFDFVPPQANIWELRNGFCVLGRTKLTASRWKKIVGTHLQSFVNEIGTGMQNFQIGGNINWARNNMRSMAVTQFAGWWSLTILQRFCSSSPVLNDF